MTETSPRFALPFILPGQAQKELFHNEALVRLDAMLHAAIEDGSQATPPADPQFGQSWIVAAGGGGAWAGHDGEIASWSGGGWRFVAPVPGMLVWHKQSGHWFHWGGTAWSAPFPVGALAVGGQQVVGARQPGVPSPSGGTTIDAEARAAVSGVIVALKSHGLID